MISNSIVFLCFVLAGVIFAEYLCLVKFLKMFFNGKINKKILDIVFQIVTPIILIGLFYLTNLFVNMGQIRVFTVLGFMLGFFLYKITFFKLLDKLHFFIYNKLTKLKVIKYTKLGKFILK